MQRSVKVGTVRIDVDHPSPLDSATVLAKIEKGQVATKESKSKQAKQEKKSAGVKREAAKAKPEKKTISDEMLLEALKKAYKGTPRSSREISDAAGFSDPEVGRQAVRSAMKRLAEAGKVETVEAEKGRVALLYRPKAQNIGGDFHNLFSFFAFKHKNRVNVFKHALSLSYFLENPMTDRLGELGTIITLILGLPTLFAIIMLAAKLPTVMTNPSQIANFTEELVQVAVDYAMPWWLPLLSFGTIGVVIVVILLFILSRRR